MLDLTRHAAELRRLTRTDPDPRVRHRADALLVLAYGRSVTEAAQDLGCCPKRIRVWRRRFLREGRSGLADRPRAGRPPVLDSAAVEVLETAVATSPLDYGYPVMPWTVADLTDLLTQRGGLVSRATVWRRLQRLGYRYRRPRHDLTHRQDAEAVVSAKHVLRELHKRGRRLGLDFALSTWMSASCTPIPPWQRSGSGAGSP